MAVIGNGSSAIQIVPGIQPSVKRIDHYVRGKTWIATTFAAEKVKERGQLDNCKPLPLFKSHSGATDPTKSPLRKKTSARFENLLKHTRASAKTSSLSSSLPTV